MVARTAASRVRSTRRRRSDGDHQPHRPAKLQLEHRGPGVRGPCACAPGPGVPRPRDHRAPLGAAYEGTRRSAPGALRDPRAANLAEIRPCEASLAPHFGLETVAHGARAVVGW